MEEKLVDIAEAVYERLLDQSCDDMTFPDIAPIFVPGHPCYEEYARMYESYDRLRQKLGGEDRDLEIVIDALLRHGKILASEMFRCRASFGSAGRTEANGPKGG